MIILSIYASFNSLSSIGLEGKGGSHFQPAGGISDIIPRVQGHMKPHPPNHYLNLQNQCKQCMQGLIWYNNVSNNIKMSNIIV